MASRALVSHVPILTSRGKRKSSSIPGQDIMSCDRGKLQKKCKQKCSQLVNLAISPVERIYIMCVCGIV